MKSRLTGFAKELRNNPTNAEGLLWLHLRDKQLDGLTQVRHPRPKKRPFLAFF